MNALTVGFMRELNPDFCTRAIMWWSKLPYSHVYIHNGSHGLHAIEHGVMLDDMATLFSGEIAAVEYEIPIDFRADLQWMQKVQREFQRADYSYAQCFGIALAKFFGMKRNILVKNQNKNLICTEFVGHVLEKYCDIDLPGDDDLWDLHTIRAALDKRGRLTSDVTSRFK